MVYSLNLSLEKTSIKEGQTHNSTGQGIHPIRGIKKAKFVKFHGLISGSKKLVFRDSFIEPLNKSDKTANKVKNVSRDTKNFEILSRALYFPIIKIIPETPSIPIDKSIAGKAEKKGILFNKTPETKLTAAIVKVPVIRLTIRNKGRY